MATRPIGNPPIWSSIANYPPGVDPWSGNARSVPIPTGEAGGFTPDTGIVAEYANAEFKVLSTWVEWLSFGSNAAGLDAHVIETDSTGVSAIAGLTAGGTAGAFPAITATANAGATGSVISATNNSGGFAILANSNGVLAAIRGVSTGLQPGIEGRNTGGGGPGISGTGDGAGSGIVGTGGATGDGVSGTGGATSGAGVSGTAIGSDPGVLGVSSLTSTGSMGVLGTASRLDSTGVQGAQLNPGADPLNATHAAIYAQAASTGTALRATAVDGYGVFAAGKSVAPVRAALHLDAQSADPTTFLVGDVIYNGTTDQLRAYIEDRWKGIWATQEGFTYGFRELLGATSTLSNVFQSVQNVTLLAPADPKVPGGLVTIAIQFEMGSAAAGSTFEWRLEDTTAGGVFPMAARTEEVQVGTGAADERYVVAKAQYIIPAAGSRSFDLQFRATDNVTASHIRRVTMEVSGCYE